MGTGIHIESTKLLDMYFLIKTLHIIFWAN